LELESSMDYYGFCKSKFRAWFGLCYVVGLMFEFGFFCGLAKWVIVGLISFGFDLLLNVDFGTWVYDYVILGILWKFWFSVGLVINWYEILGVLLCDFVENPWVSSLRNKKLVLIFKDGLLMFGWKRVWSGIGVLVLEDRMRSCDLSLSSSLCLYG